MNILWVVLKPWTTSLPFHGDPKSQPVMMLYVSDYIDNKYSAFAQWYCSAQPSVFSHVVLMSANSTVRFCKKSILFSMCSAVVLISCLMSSDKKWWNTTWRDTCIIILSIVWPSSVTQGMNFIHHFQPTIPANEYLCQKHVRATNTNRLDHLFLSYYLSPYFTY